MIIFIPFKKLAHGKKSSVAFVRLTGLILLGQEIKFHHWTEKKTDCKKVFGSSALLQLKHGGRNKVFTDRDINIIINLTQPYVYSGVQSKS